MKSIARIVPSSVSKIDSSTSVRSVAAANWRTWVAARAASGRYRMCRAGGKAGAGVEPGEAATSRSIPRG